jgi:hypothetical protein
MINLFSQVILSKPTSTQSLAAMPSGYLQHGSYPIVKGSQQDLTFSNRLACVHGENDC